MMLLQRSPCENSDCFFSNSTIVLATPVELRKASGSNVEGFFFPPFFPFARLFVFKVPASSLRIHTRGHGSYRILDRLVNWKYRRGQCVLEFWAFVTNVRSI